MSPIKSTGISNEKFGPWLRRELRRALKLGFHPALVAGGAAGWADRRVARRRGGWTNFNYRLSGVALDEHPSPGAQCATGCGK